MKVSDINVFTVNLSNYNLRLPDQGIRHTDSVNYFRELLASDLKSDSVFVVIFTKLDMLEVREVLLALDCVSYVPYRLPHPLVDARRIDCDPAEGGGCTCSAHW